MTKYLSLFRKRLYVTICFNWPPNLLFLRGFLVIIGGFLIHLSLGTNYTYGNIAPYMVSYIRNQSHPADLQESTALWIFSFALMGQGGAMFLGGWMIDKIGPRMTTLIGSWMMSLGVALSYFAIKVSFWLLLLTYGLIYGIGTGIGFPGPLSSAMKWLPKWKGLVSGIVVSGYGLSALVFDTVQTFFINPENYKPVPIDPTNLDERYYNQADLLDRVPLTFLLLAIIYATIQLIGSILITDPPEDYQYQAESPPENSLRKINGSRDEILIQQQKPSTNSISCKNSSPSTSPTRDTMKEDRDQEEDERPQNEIEKARLLNDEKNEEDFGNSDTRTSGIYLISLTPKQMLLKLNFYLLWLMFLSTGIANLFFASLYKFWGTVVINNDHFLAIVGSISALFNCLGRIWWGLLADRFSYKCALILLSGTFTIFSLTFYACILGGKYMFFVWVCIIFSCVGGVFSLFPTSIGQAFGIEHVSTNLGLLFTSQVVAGALGATLCTLLYELIGMQGLMFLVSGITMFSLVLALLYRPKRYISEQEP